MSASVIIICTDPVTYSLAPGMSTLCCAMHTQARAIQDIRDAGFKSRPIADGRLLFYLQIILVASTRQLVVYLPQREDVTGVKGSRQQQNSFGISTSREQVEEEPQQQGSICDARRIKHN